MFFNAFAPPYATLGRTRLVAHDGAPKGKPLFVEYPRTGDRHPRSLATSACLLIWHCVTQLLRVTLALGLSISRFEDVCDGRSFGNETPYVGAALAVVAAFAKMMQSNTGTSGGASLVAKSMATGSVSA